MKNKNEKQTLKLFQIVLTLDLPLVDISGARSGKIDKGNKL